MRNRGTVAAVVAWACAVLGGFVALFSYSSRPGPRAGAPTSWPAASALAPAAGRATVLLFAHPRCSCTRASLAELGRVLDRVGNRAAATVVFVEPAHAPKEFSRSDLRDEARRLAVAVRDDPGGFEAARFGAETSGTCVAYDAAGRLVYSGGLTALRGHEGDSIGEERLVRLLRGDAVDRHDAPVFGCTFADANASGEKRR